MANYNINITSTKKLVNAEMVSIQISRKDKDMIKISEIKKLTENILKENKGAKLRVRALGISSMSTFGQAVYSTLKSLDGELNVKDQEEYLNGRVADTAKFLNYSQLELSLFIPSE